MRYQSARAKRRHPCEKGEPAQLEIVRAFRTLLLNGHSWRRHSEPFAKTPAGLRRRVTRRFVIWIERGGVAA